MLALHGCSRARALIELRILRIGILVVLELTFYVDSLRTMTFNARMGYITTDGFQCKSGVRQFTFIPYPSCPHAHARAILGVWVCLPLVDVVLVSVFCAEYRSFGRIYHV